MKIKIKNITSRAALEQLVQSLDMNKSHSIEGKREELSRFGLSDTVTVYGVRVIITDTPTKKRIVGERPDRGRVKKGGILGK